VLTALIRKLAGGELADSSPRLAPAVPSSGSRDRRAIAVAAVR
jgi:hypothetical protein